MTRGRLRVFLGAAPGVGKTVAMLEEARRLAADGTDVVVGVVETHDRVGTAAALAGLEIVPRRTVEHRGVPLTEMDLEAVLERSPDLALVDELAHTNAPGGRHPKRWEDVHALLDAGIDVMTTVNVQHIESLNDVVEHVTGIAQRETVPDDVVRAADQIEVVDLAPGALRERLAHGDVYPAERIDAALSHFFRIGNLTALRELALLWLADEVDSALNDYRSANGIDRPWGARERVVVALSGGPEGDTLLRRAARIAARSSGGDLLAVHVTQHDGLRAADAEALARQRTLVTQLGGTFHHIVGEDTAAAIVEFARGANATQIVVGASRRSRWRAALGGPGTSAKIVREAGPVDVHLVNHAAAAGAGRLPHIGGALSPRRQAVGGVLALVGGPLLTWLLVSQRSDHSMVGDVLAYQLLVIAIALVGGLWPALFTAVLSALTLDFFFVQPLHTVHIGEPAHMLALGLYAVNGVLVSWVVGQAARRSRAARRAEAEAHLLSTIAGSVLRGQTALGALVAQTREAFALDGVRVLAPDGAELARSGALTGAGEDVPLAQGGTLRLHGHALEAGDRRLLAAVAAQVDAALEHAALQRTAEALAPLTETDKVKTALLSAVSHDLRRPLTAAMTSVSSLRATDVAWSAEDREELLATADESLLMLAALVTDLLDATRLQVGSLGVATAAVDVGEVVTRALDELSLGPDRVEVEVDPALPDVRADRALLDRVVVNLLANAVRHGGAGPVRIAASAFDATVEIRIVDRGPGVEDARKEAIFTAFQRRGDLDNTTGLGLGLALSRGFVEAMAGSLHAEDTPGGGLTMVVTLPEARRTP